MTVRDKEGLSPSQPCAPELRLWLIVRDPLAASIYCLWRPIGCIDLFPVIHSVWCLAACLWCVVRVTMLDTHCGEIMCSRCLVWGIWMGVGSAPMTIKSILRFPPPGPAKFRIPGVSLVPPGFFIGPPCGPTTACVYVHTARPSHPPEPDHPAGV